MVFGHTHRAGVVELGEGRRYLNPGSWLFDTAYVAIDQGQAELRRWEPPDQFQLRSSATRSH